MQILPLASAITIIVLLGGCGLTTVGDNLRADTATKGREAAAAALENAEWLLCRAMPVGAIKDRYGRSSEQAEAYSTLCGNFNDKFFEALKVTQDDSGSNDP